MAAPGVGVLLLQLGTPARPDAGAVRRYLREFLSDRRVVDASPWIWQPILHGIVLRRRPAASAALYQRVWTKAGSPLAVISAGQARGVETRFGGLDGPAPPVVVGMRYGEPSITTALTALLARGVNRLLAVPMYPQYAGATTGSSVERLMRELARLRVVPALRVVPPYFDHPAYIDAEVTIGREAGATPDVVDHLVLSFHGLPQRYVDAGDVYAAHCAVSAKLIAERLGWPATRVTLAFQSRFGREPWIGPATDATLLALAKERKRVAVMCPGFTADCLETLEEIGITGRERFMHAGGAELRVAPALNEHPAWLDGLTRLIRSELGGWRNGLPVSASN